MAAPQWHRSGPWRGQLQSRGQQGKRQPMSLHAAGEQRSGRFSARRVGLSAGASAASRPSAGLPSRPTASSCEVPRSMRPEAPCLVRGSRSAEAGLFITTIRKGPRQIKRAGRPARPVGFSPPICVNSVMDAARSGFPLRHQVSPIGAAPPPLPVKRCDSKHEKTCRFALQLPRACEDLVR